MSEPEPQKLKVGSVELPFPSWASTPLAVIVLLAALGFCGLYLWQHVRSDSAKIAPADLIQLEQQANHLAAVYSEFKVPADAWGVGRMEVRFFPADRCTLFIEQFASDGPVHSRFFCPEPPNSRASSIPGTPSAFAQRLHLGRQPVVFGATAAEAQSRCIPPQQHPGQATSWNEAIDGCQTRAWRRWEDGCKGYAVWNGCASTWSAWQWSECHH